LVEGKKRRTKRDSAGLYSVISEIEARGCLDEYALLVLTRLKTNEHGLVSEAFDAFNVDNQGCIKIVRACIEAENLKRTFPKKVEAEKATLKRISNAKRAIETLKSFMKEVEAGPKDDLDAFILYDDMDMSAAKHGLYIIETAVQLRERITFETPRRLGATRKLGGTAAVTAAIGWLAEAIRKISGEPHHNATAQLASVVLDHEISSDRVREAERTRLDRDWRASR